MMLPMWPKDKPIAKKSGGKPTFLTMSFTGWSQTRHLKGFQCQPKS
jgi:hypothetical protein